jgi:hypothetical protein
MNSPAPTSGTLWNCGLLRPVLARAPKEKKLRTEACAERFAETEAFITKAKAKLRAGEAGESPEWIETGLREAPSQTHFTCKS